ncbi:MAG: Na/Pi cotransporter family protein [Acutalibacteraceae bacterium]|nr:Na/Pi cotransporter family protein [Acutalibacteraceae bacterium]
MSVFNLISLFGGLALFLFGMNTMSGNLEKTAGGKLEKILKVMTDKPLKALLLGTAITATIQSSSAVTVMLVGLVNSGIMQLNQAIGVIMGSNIGTTVTAWILSLAGIDSNNFLVNLLKPSSFAPIVAFIGILMTMTSKKNRTKDIGGICLGFAILMFGMEMMSTAMEPLAEMEGFRNLMVMFNNPILGVLLGIVLTAVIQSSSAAIGILQALSLTGAISYGMAIPIIMGQNIGTCITALLSSIGVSKNAKRVAAVHVYFNLIGTALLLSAFYVSDIIFDFAFTGSSIEPAGIAIIHSIFNVATTIILFPFSKLLEKLARKTVKDKKATGKSTFIDDRLLNVPALAVSEGKDYTVQMGQIAIEALLDSISLVEKFDTKIVDKIIESEKKLDDYEDKLGTFLVKVSSHDLTDADSNMVSTLLHVIGDFERIGDHAVNIAKAAQEISDKQINFSENATAELKVATDAIKEILELTEKAFAENDFALAKQVEPLEQVIDDLLAEIKSRHIARLTGGKCTIELGFVLSDLLTNYERVSDHCSNIAVCQIQISKSVFDTHEYLNNYKTSGSETFTHSFDEYKNKYILPAK